MLGYFRHPRFYDLLCEVHESMPAATGGTWYRICFTGRLNLDIGITYGIAVRVQADSREAAHMSLYKRYELIDVLYIDEVPSGAWAQGELRDR